MQHHIKNHLKAIFIIIFCIQSVSAGTLATYESPEGSVIYEIEGDKVRMNISGTGHGMYQLLLGDKAYNVMTDDNGEVRVTDVGEMMGIVSGLTKMAGAKVEQLEFADTGKKKPLRAIKAVYIPAKFVLRQDFLSKQRPQKWC